MSGNGVKKVVDLAAKASKSGIDWDGMAKLLVSEEARREFSNLRRAFNDVNQTLQTKYSLVLISKAPRKSWMLGFRGMGRSDLGFAVD